MNKRNFNPSEIPLKHRKLDIPTIEERMSMIILGISNADEEYQLEKGAKESTLEMGTVQLTDGSEAIIKVQVLADSYTMTVEESSLNTGTGEITLCKTYEEKRVGHDLSGFLDRRITPIDMSNKAKEIDYFFLFAEIELGTLVSHDQREVGVIVSLIPELGGCDADEPESSA